MNHIFLLVIVSLNLLAFSSYAHSQAANSEPSTITSPPLQAPGTFLSPALEVPPLASFEGQAQNNKRYRWLAQSVLQGGTHGKDCENRRLILPWVNYEDTGTPIYKNAQDPSQPSYYSPSFLRAMENPKQLASASNDHRIFSLRHKFPKLRGQVYGFDADGKRTAELVLNADLLNISIHNQGACDQPQYPSGTASDRTERDRYQRYAKAVQALFQNEAYSAPGGAPTHAVLKKTVIFSNDPTDVPHVPTAQPASADIAAKLNARLKAKLARDLDKERARLQQEITALKSPAGLAKIANRTLDGRAPTAAENAEKAAQMSKVFQLELDALPTNIDVVFTACPALQYALDSQASRMLCMLRCSSGVFGFYEQHSNGEMVLLKTADSRTAQQKRAGVDPHPFVSGVAKFNLQSWTGPYSSAWQGRSVLDFGTLSRRASPNNAAAKYVKGTINDGDGMDFYVKLIGVYDLLPMRTVLSAQLYLSSTGHHESPFELVGLEPGDKPGDAWTQRKQTWPVGVRE